MNDKRWWKTIKLSFVAVGSIISLFLFLQPLTTHAFGLAPAGIIIENMGQQMVVERSFVLIRKNPNKIDQYQAMASGAGARYIELTNNGIAVLPKGEIEVKYPFFINTKNAPAGSYEAKMVFLPVEESVKTGVVKGEGVSSGVSFKIGAQGIIKFTVTNQQVKSFTIGNIFMPDSEVGAQVGVRYTLTNTGNVDAKPDEIRLEMVDVTDPSHVIKDSISGDQFAPVDPLQTKTLTAVFAQKFEQGLYRGTLTFLVGGKVIFEQKDIHLEVFPAGTLAQAGEFSDFMVNGETFEPHDLVKFQGILRNTGTILITGNFFVELLHEGKSIELLHATPLSVVKGEQADFTLTYKPEKTGSYQARAYFEYGAKKTPPQIKNFAVHAKGLSSLMWFIILALVVVVFGVTLVVFYRLKRKHTLF